MNQLLTAALLGTLVFLSAGCNGKPQPPAVTNGGGGGHGAHTAPPGYCGVAIGDHVAHLAVKSDPATGALEVQVFDGHFEKPVRITDASITIRVKLPPGEFVDVKCDAVADKLSGETVGDASTFRGSAPELKTLEKFDAVFQGATIKGAKFGEVPFPYPDGVKLH